MTRADRERWDERYANPISSLNKAPNSLLARYVPPAAPGQCALELACGLGHNALWLAEHGYRVEALDISLRALRHARTRAQGQGLHNITFIVADLDHFPLPRCVYDIVSVFRFLDRRLFPILVDRVRPGGMVIYQTLNVRFLEKHPTSNPAHMLQIDELPGYFPGWTVLHSHDGNQMSTYVGRKPLAGDCDS